MIGKAWWLKHKIQAILSASLKAESNYYCFSVCFSFFFQPKTPAHGMMLSTVTMSLFTAINLIEIISHRHSQRFVAQAILEPAKLAININIQSPPLDNLMHTPHFN